MNDRPPKWLDRFLEWYCNDELIEEIQGDAYDLYFERAKSKGKRFADLNYAWDVLCFFRWTNIRKVDVVQQNFATLWALNFKLVVRNSAKNKMTFFVKIIGLSICLSFALLLAAFIVNELTYDEFHVNHERIYRVSCKVTFQDHITHYAVTPFPIGEALNDGISEIEDYFRFLHEDKPIYQISDKIYHNEVTLSVNNNFLKILTFDFLHGNVDALNQPDKIVLTESLASKFFGKEDAMGKIIEYGQGVPLEVAGVVKDTQSNSHLNFDALISWDTFDRIDEWGNLNAYNYILLKPDADIVRVQAKLPSVTSTFKDLIIRDYEATFEPILENLTDIHFSQNLEEDIAEKRSKSNLFILASVVFLLLITGLINYLNLSLAELTGNLKKIIVFRVFGEASRDNRQRQVTEIIFVLLIVLPLSAALIFIGYFFASNILAIHIDQSVLFNPILYWTGIGFLILLLVSSRLNSLILSKSNHLLTSLKGYISPAQSRISTRKVLVAVQMSFSIIMIALSILIVDQFQFIENADKGFDNKNIVVMKLRSPDVANVENFSEAVRQINGVAQVESSSFYPGMIETKDVFQIETENGMKQQLVAMMYCTNDYLKTLNISINKGRSFDVDRIGDHNTAFIINESAAKEFGWKEGVGKIIKGPVTSKNEPFRSGEVIGIVKDFNFASLHNKIEPLIIFLSDDKWRNRFIYVKTKPLHSPDLVASIEKEFMEYWPQLPFEWEYLDSKYLSLYQKDYELKSIFEIGLVISILISCLGIFSISALLVTRRSKEMGIRKVVGANSLQLFFLHVKSFLQFFFISILMAWPMIWYLSGQWLQNFAYHIKLDAWNLIVPGIIALFITILTSGYHGIKSALIDPINILKHE